ncbi:MAG: ribosome assembly factor SBDS [Nanoarchaeota archaeon]
MVQTIARIKQTGKHFEIMVDMDKALAFKKTGQNNGFLEIDRIFTDAKKGFVASVSDLKGAFGTDDVAQISQKIVKSGEVMVNQEHRDEEREKRIKQVVDFISRNAVDPKTKVPHTPDRIKSALEQAHVNIKNVPIENQIQDIIHAMSKILPISMETRRIKVTIPAIQTGKAYGVVAQYKEDENWLGNGDLEVTVNIPAGILMDFYDKLNSVTHGSALTEELK